MGFSRARLAVLAALPGLVAWGLSGGGALGAAVIRAQADLDPPPAWTTPDTGSWAKHSSPVVADLDPGAGNGPEIVVGSLGGKVTVFRFNGSALARVWDSGSAIDSPVDSSPAVADLDRDGCLEVIVGAGNGSRPHNAGLHIFDCRGANHRFWAAPVGPQWDHVGVFSTPAVGDVDGDGWPEIAYGSFNQRIYVKRRDGSDLPAFSGGLRVHDTIWSSPALADVDGDGRLEVVIGTDLGGGASVFGCPKAARGMVLVMDAEAAFLPGSPKCLDTPIWSSPAVLDVNGDGRLDVVVGTNNYMENGMNVGEPWKLRAFDALDGRELWTTALESGTRIFSSPAGGDVDGDGKPEIAIASHRWNNTGEVWLLSGATGQVRWHHGSSGECCVFLGSPILADISGDGNADVVATAGDGSVWAWDASGNRILLLGLGYTFFNSPAVADLDGDGRNELVAASANTGASPPRGRVWVVGTDGTKPGPWPMFKRDAARLAAVGKGPYTPRGKPAPTTKPKSAKPPATRRAAVPRGAAATDSPPPTAAPDMPSPVPDPTPSSSPLALPASPSRRSRPPALPAAALGALVAAGASLVLARPRR